MSKFSMNQKSIRLLIFVTALSLIGLIITQLFWSKNALELANQQFDNRVTIALQGALDEYIQLYGDHPETSAGGCLGSCSFEDSLFINLVPEKIDSLLSIHFDYHGLGEDFDFAVVKCQSGEILYEKAGLEAHSNVYSKHKISLTCLGHKESHHLEVSFGSKRRFVIMGTLIWLIVSILFLLVVILSFSYTVFTVIKQKKVSEIRNDFVNNMTHEFKTPIANIAIAAEVLMRKDSQSNSSKVDQYARIIQQENLRMKSQVERVLQVAMRSKEDLSIQKESSDIHDLIESAVEHACFEDCSNVQIEFNFTAKESILNIDPMHLSNVVHNLIDNAQKYCDKTPHIEISTQNKSKSLHIQFKDNGIGLSSEAQKHVFDKFYRVPTGDIHNVKGFGLGLNYVKTITEAMNGRVHLESELGKGSCFTLVFPLP